MGFKKTLGRDFYKSGLPEDAKKIVGDGYEVYISKYKENAWLVMAFGGKRSKPDINGYLLDEERANKVANKFIEKQLEYANRKAEEKARKAEANKEAVEKCKVGDIYYSSWGYDQTNVDFYKVLEKKGSYATIVGIGKVVVDRDSMEVNDRVVANPNVIDGEPMRKKIGEYGFTLNSYSKASPWDGNPVYESGPYGGH